MSYKSTKKSDKLSLLSSTYHSPSGKGGGILTSFD
nr:MAG TPA: hypothetical protein [Caudoviricetes sp.]